MASPLLFEFVGEVIHGKGFGRTLGFPTANLSISHALALPFGVYAAHILVCRKWYDGIVNVGKHPTFPEGPPAVEAHIPGFADDLYGKTITVRLTRYIREEKVFPSTQALHEQIRKDLQLLQANDRPID